MVFGDTRDWSLCCSLGQLRTGMLAVLAVTDPGAQHAIEWFGQALSHADVVIVTIAVQVTAGEE